MTWFLLCKMDIQEEDVTRGRDQGLPTANHHIISSFKLFLAAGEFGGWLLGYMSPTKEVRYTSRSITPPKRHSKSKSPPRSRVRSCSRSQDSVEENNPGNNLYIRGLSTRVTNSDLEKYFNKEGKVLECQVVFDPRTRESRGFAFVTMETVEDAERCIKYLNRSVLEGRLITVEKAKRSRGRTRTPGKYCGAREKRDRDRKRSRSRSPYRSRHRDRLNSRGRRERSHSPYSRDLHRRRRERSMSATSDGIWRN